MMFTIHTCARSISGRRRRNEDAFYIDPNGQVFAVLDGMGGQAGGDVASSLAAEAIASFFATIANDADATWPYAIDTSRSLTENQLDAAIRLANRRIRAERRDAYAAMGTTVASMAITTRAPRPAVVLAHVGDSRVYRLRDGVLIQLTRDHSLYEQLLADGVSLPPLSEFVHANVITRALGASDDERPELRRVDVAAGDRFLLCTDGLSGDLEPQQIAALLGDGTVEEAAQALVDAAYEAGSRDNITVVVVEVDAGETTSAARSAGSSWLGGSTRP